MKTKKDMIIKNVVMIVFTVMLLASIFALSVIIGSAETYYTIRINYLFADDMPAHDPYIATYQASEDPLHLVVKNPAITGYDAMTATDNTGLSAETSTIDLDHIDRNVELTVYYVAGLSTYRVMYYKQNIYDDLYTRDNSISSEYTNRRGKTGTNPTVLENETLPGYEGFTNLFHEPDSIAADGSTVFRVYYDRNYYHVLFDLGSGGYGVEPVYAKFQSVYHISEPKRLGYTFLGWARTDKDSTQSDDWKYIDSNGNEITEQQALANPITLDGDQTVPAEDTYYKALWTSGTTSFSIVFWLQKPEVIDLTEGEIHSAGSVDAAKALIGERYNVIAAKTVTKVKTGSTVTDVQSGMEINLDTLVQSTNGTTPAVYDFFGFDFRMPENGVTYDFPNMSAAMRTELQTNKRYILYNDFLSAFQFKGSYDENGDYYDNGNTAINVAGDGSTRINVYLKRANFTLKFFYAKTNGGTESTDENGYPTLTGTYTTYLTSGTKGFSNSNTACNDNVNNELTKVRSAGWTQNVVASLPKIAAARRSIITPDKVKFISKTGDNGETDRYWYYELTSKYGADLTNTWFNDAFEIMDSTAVSGEHIYFGSWAVEYGSLYKEGRSNFTVKGRFEELSGEILFKEDYITSKPVRNPTELHFAASWDNTRGASWNTGQNKVYNFTYKNYIQLLPCHDYIAEAVGVETLITGGDYPGGTYSKNGMYMPGGHFDAGYYVDIIEMNGARYGLRADDIIETYDVGDQYETNGKLKTGKAMADALKNNQTAVKITGCTILGDSAVNYTFDSIHLSDGEVVTETITTTLGRSNNPQGIWYDRNIGDGISANHHCDVLFFYSRNKYSITYVNITETIPTPSNNMALFEEPLYMPALQPTYDPVYPVAGMEDYYAFDGWYKDPFHIQPVDFEHDIIPASEVKFYAKWIPKTIKVSFYPTYNDYYENVNRIGDEIIVDYGDYVPHELIPANIEGSERPKLNPPAIGAMFAGWYYLRDNIPVRFEPENLPVTALNQESSGENATFHLYAEWVTKEVGKYKIKYVEKNNHDNEVASPTTGRAFVWKTRTFNAKGGSELNEEHAWQEGGINWWPVVNSHSLVIKANDHTTSEYSPNEYTFEYIQKSGVWYRIQYLDAVTHTPLADPVERYTTDATVKADSLFIPGYVAEEMSKVIVLSASEKTGEAAKAEELENNVINFYYNQNDTEYLYEVEYYGQNVDDDNYELIQTENIEVEIADNPETPEVEPTTVALSDIYNRQYAMLFAANGFERVLGATKQVVTNLDGTTTTTSLADNASFTVTSDRKTTIRVYFDRKLYPYTYRYVDYHAERKYLDTPEAERGDMWNGVMETHNGASNERVEKEVTIPAPVDLTYTDSEQVDIPYIRISEDDITLMIAPDENNAEVNIINVYYRKFSERELQYKLVCKDSPYNELDYDDTKNPPQALYGGLSMTVQTVDAYNEIQSVNFYDFNEAFDPDADPSLPANERYLHNHRYTFLGWFDNPEGTGTPVSADANLSPAEMVGNTEELPAHNTTYYAVVEQDMVHANFEFRYVEEPLPVGGDSGETEEDRQAALIVSNAPTDTDGSNTGHVFNFTNPNNYTSGDPIPWERTLGYNATVDPVDNRVYKYEFAEWWEEDLTPGENYGKLIRKKNWNSDGEWSPTVLQQVLDRRSDKHVIAVFVRRQVDSLPYTINYVYTDRTGAERTYTVKGTLTGDELRETSANAKVNNSGAFELTDSFIMENAPYETNYGETLLWTDTETVKKSFTGDSKEGTVDRIVTTVTAQQSTKKVFLNYRLTPTGEYTTIDNIDYGANRKSDERIKALDLTGATYNDKYFTYWAVRKKPRGEVIAKCYDAQFSLCMMDSYYVSPVFETAASDVKTATLDPSKLAVGNEDWLAWTWNNEEDGIVVQPNSELVFTGLKNNVIFVRVSSGTTELGENWSNVWNQTADLTVANRKTFTLTGWNGDYMNGTWSNVKLTHLDYTRNRWTNENGELFPNGSTDLLYTDFEIAFEDGNQQLYGSTSQYKAGVVFELCARWDPNNEFEQDHDYGYVSNEANLKAAISQETKPTYYYYTDGKRRSIQIDEFSGSELTSKNRIIYSKPYKNAYKETVDPSTGETVKTYTNSTYLMKVTAYLKDPDGNITLSNSVYVCLTDIAGCDFATNGMTQYTDD